MRYVAIVSVPVSDQERAKDFYLNALGFELVSDETMGEQRWIEVKPAGAETAPTLVAGSSTQPAGVPFATLACDNADESFEALKAKGVNFQGEPETAFWGRYVQFADPDGNSWVLVSEAPDAPMT
jgi:predicted enzyme related to lactoylglutathione lyase